MIRSMAHRGAALFAVPLILTAAVACSGGGPTPSGTPTPAGPDVPPAAVAPEGGDRAAYLARVLGAERAAQPTTLDGVYTDAQADRGVEVFEAVCGECHAPTDWTEGNFLARWNGESVWRFWHYVWEQMPEGDPPYTLSREQVTDAVAYILRLNGLPTGDAELGTEDDALDVHWLVWPPEA